MAESSTFQQLELSFHFLVPARLIYETLTVQQNLMIFTQSAALSEPCPQGKFQLYGGTIEGQYLNLDTPRRLEMLWRFKDWDSYSHVTIDFEESDNEVVISLKQTEVPTHDKYGKHVHLDNLENGWRSNIFERISKVFGYPLKK